MRMATLCWSTSMPIRMTMGTTFIPTMCRQSGHTAMCTSMTPCTTPTPTYPMRTICIRIEPWMAQAVAADAKSAKPSPLCKKP